MTKLIHAFYNMDINSVELTYNDGSVLTIDCEKPLRCYKRTDGRPRLAAIQRRDGVC